MESSSSTTTNYRERYQELSGEILQLNGCPAGDDLCSRVTTLFYEVAESKQGGDLVKDCADLIDRLEICREKPETIENPEEMRTIFGSISQFSEESNSSCTSCAQAFLRSVLPLGMAWDVTSEQVTSFIKMGLGYFYALHAQAIGEDTALQGDYHAAFSTPEICSEYGLKLGPAHSERVLEIDLETGTLVPFFAGQLNQLANGLSSEKTGVGATIHCHGNTYALAIFDTHHGREYVFFDSHGNSALNQGNNNGYIKYTFSLEVMATFLAEVMPFWFVEHREGMSQEQQGEIERDNNSYILYPLELCEKGILAETGAASSSSDSIPTRKDFFDDDSLKKTNSIAGRIFTFLAVAVACVAFWFRDHTVSVFTSVAQKIFAPSPTLLEKIQ